MVHRNEVVVDLFDPRRDGIEPITAMLHRAYAPHARAGMNFVAASQDHGVTERRLTHATAAWIARAGERIVGTVVYYAAPPVEDVPQWYRSADVGIFAQFAVEPETQRRGVGRLLLDAVEQHAVADGKRELACDTAEPATNLRGYYERLGFREVARYRWPHATYESVILSKALDGER